MNPNVILFTDTSRVHRAIRPGGVYKVASILRKQGYRVIVNPYCTNLTKKAWREVAKKYKSKDLIWIGLSTTFLTFPVDKLKKWRDEFENSDAHQIDHENIKGGFKVERIVEDIVYNDEHLNFLQNLFDVPVLIGGSQLTRNKNIGKTQNKNIITIPGYVDDIIINITEKLKSGDEWTDDRKSVYGFNRESYRRSRYIFTKEDHIDEKEWLPIEVNRGCAFKCAYCTYDNIGLKDNYKFSETLLTDIQRNHDEFGTTGYFVLDDLYNDTNEKVQDLYENVWSKLNFKIEWNAYCRLDLIWRFPDQANILQDSGLRATGFGIETLNDKAGKLVGKGLGKERILDTLVKLKEIWKDDIATFALWIAGLPGELPDSWEQTLRLQLDNDFVHGHGWQALYINHQYDTLHKSLIDQQYEKYGYSIINGKWQHQDNFNEHTANEFVNKANNLIIQNKGINLDHYGYGTIRSDGFSHDAIMKHWHSDNITNLSYIKNLKKREKFTNIFLN